DDASCVVHLAGILIETRASRYESANVATTSSVVEAARLAGVDHIVLVSVLHADPDSGNRYLASKGEAERIVTESGIATTILRTPILLGAGTAGADSLLRGARAGRTTLIGGGRYVLHPLDVDDLSRAILAVCDDLPDGVRVHELVGPEGVTHRDLIARTAQMMGREVSIGSVPTWLAKAAAAVSSRLSGGGMTPTVIDVITSEEIVERNADDALGIELTPLAKTLEKIVAASEASG
ncbi:MAG: NAD(P)H-binding protein, partial [Acidobacteria bacterium]|nr:NAD(P)H-binding protein [Acidobacteriota bacterium]NIM64289.1 NAD(P)H-binding protein [Acidobacteriota bacterium]NIT11886.1 NAD(P)H-binding protein [Acidobacteriota bacterium]